VPVPGNILAGHLNSDGHSDLVVASAKERSVRVFVNDGRGRFTPAAAQPVRLSFFPAEVTLGDLNGDGKLDLGIADHDSYLIRLFLGDGKGGFAAAETPAVMTSDGRRPHTHGLVFHDVNADRKLDLLAVNSEDDNVSVLLGNGRGGFAPVEGSPFRVGRSPYPLTIEDMDGDAKLDLLTPNVEGGDVSILVGDGRGHFAPSGWSPVNVGDRGYFIATGDFNQDNRPDFVVSHDDSTRISVWLDNGLQGFQRAPTSPLDIGNRGFQVAVVDINQDSRMDLVVASNTCVTVMLGDGRGNFSGAPGSPFSVGKGTWRLAIADFNGDDKPDVASANLESDTVTILFAR